MSAVQTKLVCVSTSRADFSHLRWPLRKLIACESFDVRLYVTGAHLVPTLGMTVQEIIQDGFRVQRRIPCHMASDDDQAAAQAIGLGTLGFAQAFAEDRPDLVFLVADRYELMAPACAAMAMRIPIAHLEGGEVSEGAIDDSIRNAITKMAHVHLTPHQDAADRVLAMGEEPWRVHVVGAPSLDQMAQEALLPQHQLEEQLQVKLVPAPILVAYHPVTLDTFPAAESIALFEALTQIEQPVWFCFPNADHHYLTILQRARRFCSQRPSSRLFVNLQPRVYWSLLGQAQLLVGNSSSGIMETASLALPTVNIGRRQQGRLKARNIIDCDPEPAAIIQAIEEARSPDFKISLSGMQNPYGDGTSAQKIADILQRLPDRSDLLWKRALNPPKTPWT